MKRKGYDDFIAISWAMALVVGFGFGWAWAEVDHSSGIIKEGECYSIANEDKSGSLVVRIVEVGNYSARVLTKDGRKGLLSTTNKSRLPGYQVDCKFYVLYQEAK